MQYYYTIFFFKYEESWEINNQTILPEIILNICESEKSTEKIKPLILDLNDLKTVNAASTVEKINIET